VPLTTHQRGYGAPHQQERKRWARLLQQKGALPCARGTSPNCIQLIRPTDTWHLDHSDDRTRYLGPSCVPCNTRAGALKGNRSPKRKRGAAWRPRLPKVTTLHW